jgi:O-antigen/teichoic acid export membrane protein
MLVKEQQNRLAWLVVISLSINLLLNLILDPAFGANGAAIARLLSTITFFLPNYLFVIRNIHPHAAFRNMAKPVFATLIMAAIVWYLRHMSIWIPILMGAVVYLFIFLLLDRDTRSYLLRFIKTNKSYSV